MTLQDVECGLCGLSLGLGVPGARRWCSDCGRYVLENSVQGEGAAVLGGVAALVAGLAAAYLLRSLLAGRR
jgi:hypothetical protein